MGEWYTRMTYVIPAFKTFKMWERGFESGMMLNPLSQCMQESHDISYLSCTQSPTIIVHQYSISTELDFTFILNRWGSVNMPLPPRTVCHASFCWDTARFIAPLIPGYPRKMCAIVNLFQHVQTKQWGFDGNCQGFWSYPAGLLGKFTHMWRCPITSLDIRRNDFII